MSTQSKWSPWDGDDSSWDAKLIDTAEKNIYQSDCWAKHRANFGWNCLRLVSPTNSGMAQVLFKAMPGITIAWIPGGPVGDLRLVDANLVKEIRNQTGDRPTYVRLNCMRSYELDHEQVFATNRWKRVKSQMSSGLSLHYSLQESESSRHKNLSANWARNLRRGEERNKSPYFLESIKVAEVIDLYKKMTEYKDLATASGLISQEAISSLLTTCEKRLVAFRCDDENGNPLALRAALVFGNKAWDILAAVSPQGRKLYSSYVTTWKLLNHCADSGISSYDLSGVDPINNKGVYDFKHGTGATELKYVGEWDFGAPSIVQPVVGRLLKYRRNL